MLRDRHGALLRDDNGGSGSRARLVQRQFPSVRHPVCPENMVALAKAVPDFHACDARHRHSLRHIDALELGARRATDDSADAARFHIRR